MKILKFILPIILVSVLLLSSCKKDDPEEEKTTASTYTVKVDGEEADGKTFTYNEFGDDGRMGFNITNNITSDIKLKVKVVSVDGDGTGIQLCFNSCTANVVLDYEDYRTLVVGQTTTSAATHILNASDGSQNLKIGLRISQVDDNNVEVSGGKVVNFTYNYVAP